MIWLQKNWIHNAADEEADISRTIHHWLVSCNSESLKLQPQLLLRAVYVMNVLFQLQMKIYHLTTITRLRLLHLLNVLLSPQELSE